METNHSTLTGKKCCSAAAKSHPQNVLYVVDDHLPNVRRQFLDNFQRNYAGRYNLHLASVVPHAASPYECKSFRNISLEFTVAELMQVAAEIEQMPVERGGGPIHHVLSNGEEAFNVRLADTRKSLGLQPSLAVRRGSVLSAEEQIRIERDLVEKIHQKKAVRKAGIPTAEFVTCKDNSRESILEAVDQIASEKGYPIVVKASKDSLASECVVIMTEEKEKLEEDFECFMEKCAPGNDVLVEQFLPGEVLNCDGAILDGKLQLLLVDRMAPGNCGIYEVYHSLETDTGYYLTEEEDGELLEEIRTITERTLHTLGMERGWFNLELMLNTDAKDNQDELSFIEIQPRCGGYAHKGAKIYEMPPGGALWDAQFLMNVGLNPMLRAKPKSFENSHFAHVFQIIDTDKHQALKSDTAACVRLTIPEINLAKIEGRGEHGEQSASKTQPNLGDCDGDPTQGVQTRKSSGCNDTRTDKQCQNKPSKHKEMTSERQASEVKSHLPGVRLEIDRKYCRLGGGLTNTRPAIGMAIHADTREHLMEILTHTRDRMTLGPCIGPSPDAGKQSNRNKRSENVEEAFLPWSRDIVLSAADQYTSLKYAQIQNEKKDS